MAGRDNIREECIPVSLTRESSLLIKQEIRERKKISIRNSKTQDGYMWINI